MFCSRQIMNMFFRTFLFFCTLLVLASCSTSEQIRYNGYENFKVSDIATEPKVNVDVKLHNPNPIGITLKDMSLTVDVDNKPLGTVGLSDKVRVKRKSDFVLPVEFNTTLPQLGGILSSGLTSFISDKELPIGISGRFTIQKFIIFRKTFEFNYTDSLNVKSIK